MAEIKVPFTTEKPISQKLFTSSIAQIPAYEDSGIKFQGKYKAQISANNFEIKAQQTRFYCLSATAIGNTVFTRQNKPTTRFYCTKMIVQSYGKAAFGVTSYDTLSDLTNGVYSLKFALWLTAAAQDLVIDFSDSPRLFTGDFVINKCSAGGAEFTTFTLYGWEEQI